VRIDPEAIGFDTTADSPDLEGVVGQSRACEAIEFGAGMPGDGFNIFALGPWGAGRRSTLREVMRRLAADREPGDDWVYVYNFREQHRPRAIRLPRGKAVPLRRAMADLVEDLAVGLPAAFETEEYKSRRSALEAEGQSQQEEKISDLRERAEDEDIALIRTPMGLTFAPVSEGSVVKPEVFKTWPEEDRKRVQEKIEEFQEELNAIIQHELPAIEKEVRDKVRQLDREVASSTIELAVKEVANQFEGIEAIEEYLEAVRSDLNEHFHLFLQLAQAGEQVPLTAKLEHPALRRYAVNVIDGDGPEAEDGALPVKVVEEPDPTHSNLIGRIEYQPQQGALITDHTLIKPGALHRANRGFLILEARSVLMQPFAWEALKRALKTRQIRIAPMSDRFGLVSTISLEPDEIPLDVKVGLVGDRMLYYLLSALDPDFPQLFKVQADFEDDIDRSEENVAALARLVAEIQRREELRPFDRGGVAAVLEQASRLADDAQKVSLRIEGIGDLMREAEHKARGDGADTVSAEHVQAAVEARRRRAGRLRDRAVEMVSRDIVKVDTTGAESGQVNGLSVIELGDTRFGRPARITARTRVGSGKIVDIEREVELGGPIHSKGVMILSSFLSTRYGGEHPVSLQASLVFEQSYGGIEGDSASSAELYALLSALSEVPIGQRFAVTGSVDQFGRVQAIGGVNEKIEGFFDVCSERGLSGDQGVLIPESNVQHLNLREDVVDAVREGKFHVWPVSHIDEGIALLTGEEAGAQRDDGSFPDGTINARVAARLARFAEIRRAYAKAAAEEPGAGREEGETP
jgi:lon-related putative ATP-dependent protease